MNPTNICPRCGRPYFGALPYCSTCGTPLRTTGRSFGLKFFLGLFAVFVAVLWAGGFYALGSREAAQPLPPAASSLLSTAPAPSLELTSAQHLAEAKRALAAGYRPNKDPKKASLGEVLAARWHLKAISSGSPEYREAQELLKEVAKREKQVELVAKRPAPEAAAAIGAQGVGESKEEEDSSSYATSSSPPASQAARQPARAAAATDRQPAASQSAGTSSSDYYTNTYGERVRRPTFSDSGPPAGASAQCRDGSYSFSRTRRGTCSHHGGVARWL